MQYTIYRITNTINKKTYIGKHQTLDINDDYFGSGRSIVAAIKKYGRENFVKEILFIFDNENDMNCKERELVTEDFAKRPDTYNIGIGGQGGPLFKGKNHSEETREKMRARVCSEETREKMSRSLTGRTRKPFSAEHRGKISAALQGKPELYESRRGRPQSEDHKKKISAALTGIKRGPMSDEEKLKRSLAQKGKPRPNSKTLS